MFSAFNPSKCTHTWSSGQPTLRRPRSIWGFGALLKGLTSVVDNSMPEPRFEPTTSGYKSNALSTRATTAPIIHVFITVGQILKRNWNENIFETWCFGGPTQLAYSAYSEDRLWLWQICNSVCHPTKISIFQINSAYRNANSLHHNNSKYPVHVGEHRSRPWAAALAQSMLMQSLPTLPPVRHTYLCLPRPNLTTSPLLLSLSHTPSAEFKLGGTAEFVTAATVMLMAGNNGRLGHVSISEGASWNIASDEDLNLLSIDLAVLMKMHTGPRGLS